jgi:hypothetical protein
MNSEHIVYIPRRAKVIITVLAFFIFLLSISVVLFSLLTGVDASLVTTALTLAQTCAAGLSVIALIFYTKFSAGVAFLKERTATYLMKEIPEALRIVDCDEDDFRELDASYSAKPVSSRTRILIKYDDGNHYCQYRVLAYGLDQRLYVQVNVKRMVVSYFLAIGSMDDEEIRKRLEYVVKAAETAGYTYKYEHVHDSADRSVTVQLRLFRSLPDEFLVNAGERLYIANDLASMTRALIRALPERVVELPPPPADATNLHKTPQPLS